jgi:hypothetical protein
MLPRYRVFYVQLLAEIALRRKKPDKVRHTLNERGWYPPGRPLPSVLPGIPAPTPENLGKKGPVGIVGFIDVHP